MLLYAFDICLFFSCNAMSFTGCSSLSEVNLPLEKQRKNNEQSVNVENLKF